MRLSLTMHADVLPRLVETHYGSLYRFALSLTRDSAAAAYLTHRTFSIWAANCSRGHEVGGARQWLFATIYREYRRWHGGTSRPAPREQRAAGEKHAGSEVAPEAIARMAAQSLLEALQDMDPEWREPLTLFYLEDFSAGEIGRILAVPVPQVIARLSWGKAALRARLAQKVASDRAADATETSVRS